MLQKVNYVVSSKSASDPVNPVALDSSTLLVQLAAHEFDHTAACRCVQVMDLFAKTLDDFFNATACGRKWDFRHLTFGDEFTCE